MALISDSHIEKTLNRLIANAKKAKKAKKAKHSGLLAIFNQACGVRLLLLNAQHPSLRKAELACHEISLLVSQKSNTNEDHGIGPYSFLAGKEDIPLVGRVFTEVERISSSMKINVSMISTGEIEKLWDTIYQDAILNNGRIDSKLVRRSLSVYLKD